MHSSSVDKGYHSKWCRQRNNRLSFKVVICIPKHLWYHSTSGAHQYVHAQHNSCIYQLMKSMTLTCIELEHVIIVQLKQDVA